MSAVDPAGSRGRARPDLEAARSRLRQAAHQLEGVFMAQLFQAMRATVPDSGDAGGGQAMFTSMLDDELAARAADRMHRGLGEALYRQLSRRLPAE
ncbi:MAG TPA: rod-binding protein [Gemmatimonadales bacterium]|nr:rod-binding protein [Gemmatimonadales bacterium]